MRFYPDLPARRLRSLVRDVLIVAALVAFALLGLWVHDLIDKLAVLGEGVRKVGSRGPRPRATRSRTSASGARTTSTASANVMAPSSSCCRPRPCCSGIYRAACNRSPR